MNNHLIVSRGTMIKMVVITINHVQIYNWVHIEINTDVAVGLFSRGFLTNKINSNSSCQAELCCPVLRKPQDTIWYSLSDRCPQKS